MRPLRIKQYTDMLVSRELGKSYLKKDYEIMKKTCEDDNIRAVLIISKEWDTRETFEEVAKEMNIDIRLISAGLDNTNNMDQMILDCLTSDKYKQWLLIQNIHLLDEEHLQHMSHLIITTIAATRDTRYNKLLLTTTPGPTHIPHSLLRFCKIIIIHSNSNNSNITLYMYFTGNKITMEQERGLKNKLLQLTQNMSQYDQVALTTHAHTRTYQRCLFNTFLFHTFLLERREFGQNTFNCPYIFDNGNLRYALQHLMVSNSIIQYYAYS